MRTTLVADLPTTLSMLGVEVRARMEGRLLQRTRSLRVGGVLELERPLNDLRIASRTIASATSASNALLAQDLTYFGGPISAPGYRFHALTGRAGVSQRLELQMPVPFVGFSLGRFGRAPSRAVLTPFVTGVYIRQVDAARTIAGVPAPWNSGDPLRPTSSGFYPSAGIGLLTFFDLLRFDVARGLNGGRWSFYVDVNRAFWSVL